MSYCQARFRRIAVPLRSGHRPKRAELTDTRHLPSTIERLRAHFADGEQPSVCDSVMSRAPFDPAAVECKSSDEPSRTELAAIDEGLESHNHSLAPLDGVKQLATLAKDGEGRLLGGAIGRTWGRCCELLQLWVDSQHRGLGIGTACWMRLKRTRERAAAQSSI